MGGWHLSLVFAVHVLPILAHIVWYCQDSVHTSKRACVRVGELHSSGNHQASLSVTHPAHSTTATSTSTSSSSIHHGASCVSSSLYLGMQPPAYCVPPASLSLHCPCL